MDLAEVSALFDEPGNERMSERVWRNADVQRGDFTVILDTALDLARWQSAMTAIGQERGVGGGGEPARAQELDQFGDGPLSTRVERYLAGAVALADRGRKIKPGARGAVGPDVADIDAGQLGNPDPGVES